MSARTPEVNSSFILSDLTLNPYKYDLPMDGEPLPVPVLNAIHDVRLPGHSHDMLEGTWAPRSTLETRLPRKQTLYEAA